MLQLISDLPAGGQAAIDGDGEVRKLALEPVHQLIAQRRYFAIFFRAQAFEPGVARMDDEDFAAGLANGTHKIAHKLITFGFVDADAVLHSHGHAHDVHHGFDAISHKLRLGHQAGTKSTALHALAGATAVEVDLVIAPLLAQFGAMRQVSRLAAAQLQGHRMLFSIEPQMPLYIAMDQRARRHHLRVQQRVATQQAVKVAAMPVRPVHHGCDGQAPGVCGAGQDRVGHGQMGGLQEHTTIFPESTWRRQGGLDAKVLQEDDAIADGKC